MWALQQPSVPCVLPVSYTHLKGYNSVSRHIVYAGGVAKDGKTPKDTRTGCQKKALEKYVKDFHLSLIHISTLLSNPAGKLTLTETSKIEVTLEVAMPEDG